METMQTEEVLEKYPLGDEVVISTLDLPEILMGFVVPVQEFKNIPYLSHFPFVTTVFGEEIYAKKDQVVYAGDLARAFDSPSYDYNTYLQNKVEEYIRTKW